MKSAIVVCATVFVWSAAVAFTPKGKDDKFADVNVEEVCKDRCVRRLLQFAFRDVPPLHPPGAALLCTGVEVFIGSKVQ